MTRMQQLAVAYTAVNCHHMHECESIANWLFGRVLACLFVCFCRANGEEYDMWQK